MSVPSPNSDRPYNKKDDRKRAAPDDSDSLPRQSKKATLHHDVTTDSKSPSVDFQAQSLDAILPDFQKDAMYRQMKEYKRINAVLEEQLQDLEDRCQYHDGHIRAINAWLFQLLDELRILAPTPELCTPNLELSGNFILIENSSLFADDATFQTQLSTRSSEVKRALTEIFAQLPLPPVAMDSLRGRLSDAIGSQMKTQIKLEAATTRQEDVLRRLQVEIEARQRLERIIDRLRSPVARQVENLPPASRSESQLTLPSADLQTSGSMLDGAFEISDSHRSLRESLANVDRLRDEVRNLELENEKLEGEVSRHLTRLATLSDDDYSHTDLYKSLKGQYDGLVTQIDNLVATNTHFTECNRELEKQVNNVRAQLEKESAASHSEIEFRLTKAESDLARVRQMRDDYLAQISSQRSMLEEGEKSKLAVSAELTEKVNRIISLELEVERLKLDEQTHLRDTVILDDLQSTPRDNLCLQIVKLRSQQDLLTKELSAMATAYQKASSLASDRASTQRRLDLLLSHKSKADGKTFASMKRLETLETENKSLRLFRASNTELVTKLKDADKEWKGLCSNLEAQVSTGKVSHQVLYSQYLLAQKRLSDSTITADTLNTQVAELKKLLSSRDAELASLSRSHRAVEIDLEGVRTKLGEAKKSIDSQRKKSRVGESQEELMLRHIAYCTLCKRNLKDTVLKSCGHVFCNSCVLERITSRSRKCPYCMTSFGVNDYRSIILDP